MIKTFTTNDVIRFVYDEVTPEERSQMELLLINDASFLRLYKKYGGMKHKIRTAALEPSEDVINRILSYSKSFSLQQ